MLTTCLGLQACRYCFAQDFNDMMLYKAHPERKLYTSWLIVHCRVSDNWGTGIRGLMSGMATLPLGNQELLVVRDKVGRPRGELGVSKSMECDISLQCFDTVGWAT